MGTIGLSIQRLGGLSFWSVLFIMISSALEHSVCVCEKYMVCTDHRLQCKTLHFTKHKFPICMQTECSNAPEINCIHSYHSAPSSHVTYM